MAAALKTSGYESRKQNVSIQTSHWLHCGRLFQSTREVKASNPVWAHDQSYLAPVGEFNFLTEHHAIKAYWGSGGIAPYI
jgi:hypothetical protein